MPVGVSEVVYVLLFTITRHKNCTQADAEKDYRYQLVASEYCILGTVIIRFTSWTPMNSRFYTEDQLNL